MYLKKPRHVSKGADKRNVHRTHKKALEEADVLRLLLKSA
jgi:hypothetical protein